MFQRLEVFIVGCYSVIIIRLNFQLVNNFGFGFWLDFGFFTNSRQDNEKQEWQVGD